LRDYKCWTAAERLASLKKTKAAIAAGIIPPPTQCNRCGKTTGRIDYHRETFCSECKAHIEKSEKIYLAELVHNCYSNAKQNKFYCVYLDLASRYIDQIMVEDAAKNGMNFPKTEFFDDELFGGRVGPVFEKANMDMNSSNEYLQNVTPIVNKMVDNSLRGKK